jgi:hypothetical protein
MINFIIHGVEMSPENKLKKELGSWNQRLGEKFV